MNPKEALDHLAEIVEIANVKLIGPACKECAEALAVLYKFIDECKPVMAPAEPPTFAVFRLAQLEKEVGILIRALRDYTNATMKNGIMPAREYALYDAMNDLERSRK